MPNCKFFGEEIRFKIAGLQLLHQEYTRTNFVFKIGERGKYAILFN